MTVTEPTLRAAFVGVIAADERLDVVVVEAGAAEPVAA